MSWDLFCLHLGLGAGKSPEFGKSKASMNIWERGAGRHGRVSEFALKVGKCS